MEATKLNGTIHFIGQPQKLSEKFTKRELILLTGDKYPQHILVQFTNDKCYLLDNVRVGDEVSISINIRGRLWTDPKTGLERYFNTIEAWSMEFTSKPSGGFAPPVEKEQKPIEKKFPETPKTSIFDDSDDDGLPF